VAVLDDVQRRLFGAAAQPLLGGSKRRRQRDGDITPCQHPAFAAASAKL